MSESDDPWQESPHPPTPGRFRGNQSLGVAVVALGGVFILGDVLSAVSAPFALRSYHRAAEQGIDPTTVVTAHDFAVLFVFIGLPMWIVTSLWLARARSNAAALVPTGLHRSAIWCWLGWVVPIVSFWFPKQIVDDSWELTSNRLAAADSPGRYRSTRTWWALWISYGVGSYLLSRIAAAGPAEDRGVNVVTETIIAGLGVAALVAWAQVVRGVSAAQEALVASSTGGSSPY